MTADTRLGYPWLLPLVASTLDSGHFRVEYDLLTHVTKFQSFTAIGSIFLAFYSRFHGCHYLALFRKLRLKLQEVTSLAQHEKFHMANFHMDSTS